MICAAAIDRYLGGDGVVVKPLAVERRISGVLLEQETPRQKCRPEGFDAAQALAEASRCLRGVGAANLIQGRRLFKGGNRSEHEHEPGHRDQDYFGADGTGPGQ